VSAPTPEWKFVTGPDGTWQWQNTTAGSDSAFSTLEAAIADAETHRFDKGAVYWVVRRDGRTTHFRPGEHGVTLPDTQDLQ
jgi:hypothetical protein